MTVSSSAFSSLSSSNENVPGWIWAILISSFILLIIGYRIFTWRLQQVAI